MTNRRNAGFSLLEVTCAVLILGVALVSLTMGMTTALKSSKDSELQTAAAWFAAGRIEWLRTEGGLVDTQTEGAGDGLPAPYRWRQTLTAAGIEGLHEVQVQVEDPRSAKIVFELRTLLFEPPEESGLLRETQRRPGASRRGGEARR